MPRLTQSDGRQRNAEEVEASKVWPATLPQAEETRTPWDPTNAKSKSQPDGDRPDQRSEFEGLKSIKIKKNIFSRYLNISTKLIFEQSQYQQMS